MMSNAATRSDSRPLHYIAEWAEHLGIERQAIMDATGADKSLVSRWFSGTLPTGRYLNSLAKLFGIDPSDLFRPPVPEGPAPEVPSDDLSSEDVAHVSQHNEGIGTLPYGGIVEAGTFKPVDLLNQNGEKRRVNVAPIAKYARARQAAYEIRGDSMELRGLVEGMWAVGIHIDDYADIYGRTAQDEQLVVVRRTRFQGSEIEFTIKEVRLFRDRTELIPRSKNTSHKTLVVTANTEEGDEQIEIAAIVAWAGWSYL